MVIPITARKVETMDEMREIEKDAAEDAARWLEEEGEEADDE